MAGAEPQFNAVCRVTLPAHTGTLEFLSFRKGESHESLEGKDRPGHRGIQGNRRRDRRKHGGRGRAVVVNYASSKAGADAVVERIVQNEGKAVAVQADVSKPEDIQRLFAETKKAFGKLDILVNNAGIYEFLPLESITAEHFHKQFNLNVLGLLLVTQEAVKHFGPEGGSIVNISSVAATAGPCRPLPCTAAPKPPSTP